MNFRPIGDRILVKPDTQEEKTKGGILIPKTVEEKSTKGTVIAVGTGRWVKDQLIPSAVKYGDTIYFTKYSGTEVKIEDVTHLILREDDILGTVD